MKIFIVSSIALFLAGCQSQPLVLNKTKLSEIQIPSEILDCDRIRIQTPDPKTLRNKDIIIYMQRLERALNECQGDNTTVKTLIDKYNIEVRNFNQENIKNE